MRLPASGCACVSFLFFMTSGLKITRLRHTQKTIIVLTSTRWQAGAARSTKRIITNGECSRGIYSGTAEMNHFSLFAGRKKEKEKYISSQPKAVKIGEPTRKRKLLFFSLSFLFFFLPRLTNLDSITGINK